MSLHINFGLAQWSLCAILILSAVSGCSTPQGQGNPRQSQTSGYAPPGYPPPGYPPPPSYPPPQRAAITGVTLQTLPQTIALEHQDRINRFNRLSNTVGIKPPQIDELQLATGQVPGFNHPVPVVRIVFDSKVFFDFDKDVVRPEALKILDVIAENMRHDVPDAQLLVLGHTDAVGTDAYNIDLSRRRAATVLDGLVARGVRSGQLSLVAIGKSQPIAPNSTDEGRAKNRRVEFMISATQNANVAVVQRRTIIQDYLLVKPTDEPARLSAARVEVLRLDETQTASLGPSSNPNQPSNQVAALKSAETVELEKPIPLSFAVNKPAEYAPSKLRDGYVIE